MTGWRFSRTVLLFLAMALGLGAIGALLAAPASPASPVWYPGGPAESSASLLRTVGIVLAAVALAPFAYLLYQRIRNRSLSVPQIFTTLFLVILLLLVGFLALVHFLHPGGGGPLGGTGTNGTGIPPPGGGTGLPHNGTPPNVSVPGLHGLPYWVLFAAVAIAVLVVVGIAGPRLLARSRKAEEPPSNKPIQKELELALRRMDAEPSTDPREIILTLYARLLLHVHRAHGDTEILTPREIARLLEEQFQVRASGARQLTRIFEEARYSTAPLSPGSTGAMRLSLEEVLADLRHAAPIGGALNSA